MVESIGTTMLRQDQTKLKYILYARKSSESDDRQAASIEDQLGCLLKIAKEQKLNVVEVLTEAKSSKKPGSPIFNSMLEKIDRGEANAILTWKINRLSRNPVDSASISWALQQSKIKEIRTYDRTYLPDDNVFVLLFEQGIANQYILDLKSDIRRGLDKKLEKGWRPGLAPIGYINEILGEQGHKKILIDPERFDIVRHVWDLMLTGNYSVPQIWQTAKNDLGLTTYSRKKLGGKPLSLGAVYSMLKNPFYSGKFEYPRNSGNWHPGKHTPIVTTDEFNEVQRIMGRKDMPRPKEHTFAFTGVMRCGNCGLSITAENKVKKQKNGNVHHYVFYDCTHRNQKTDKKCTEKSVELKNLNLQIKQKLSELSIAPEFQAWAIKHLHEVRKNEAKSDELTLKTSDKEIQKITEQLKSLNLSYTAPENADRSIISQDEYIEMKNDFLKQKAEAEERRSNKVKNIDQWIELSEKTFNFALYAQTWFENGTDLDGKAILSCLGSNLTIKDKKLNVSLHPFFESFVKAKKVEQAEITMVRTFENNQDKRKKGLCTLFLHNGTESWTELGLKSAWAKRGT